MIPIGLPLYTVGQELDTDPFGTLKQIAQIGYREVELSPLSRTSPDLLRAAVAEVGLKATSAHHLLPALLHDLNAQIELARQLGLEYIVLTVPWTADRSRVKANPNDGAAFFFALIESLTLDDWKWNADQFNQVGEQLKKAGLQLAYHNHNFGWERYGDVTGYDELLRLTDPNFVKLELDCGWAVVAGQDPVAYLEAHPDRYRLLHLKDFRPGFTPRTTLMDQLPGAPVPTELGRGVIDYGPILAAAERVSIRTAYVEQEPPFTDMPALDSIQASYRYLEHLHR